MEHLVHELHLLLRYLTNLYLQDFYVNLYYICKSYITNHPTSNTHHTIYPQFLGMVSLHVRPQMGQWKGPGAGDRKPRDFRGARPCCSLRNFATICSSPRTSADSFPPGMGRSTIQIDRKTELSMLLTCFTHVC